jgi:AAA domain
VTIALVPARDYLSEPAPPTRYSPMTTAHRIHGFLGVGKTTLARQLEQRIPAIRFSHDEWMARLYGFDSTRRALYAILPKSL